MDQNQIKTPNSNLGCKTKDQNYNIKGSKTQQDPSILVTQGLQHANN